MRPREAHSFTHAGILGVTTGHGGLRSGGAGLDESLYRQALASAPCSAPFSITRMELSAIQTVVKKLKSNPVESPFRNTRIRESELNQDIPLERL